MTHRPMRSVIKLSHLQVMNTVSSLPTGGGGGGRGKFFPQFSARGPRADLSITGNQWFFFFSFFFPCTRCPRHLLKYRRRELFAKAPEKHLLNLYHLTAAVVKLFL